MAVAHPSALCYHDVEQYAHADLPQTVACELLAASRNGLFFIPSILVLPCWLGLTGVEVCQSVSDLFAFIVTVPVMVYTFRELRA